MFSVITNIYNKKTKGPTLMEFFTVCVARSWISYQYVPCHPWCTRWRVCGKNLNIVSMCAVSPVVHTTNIS